MAFQPHSIRRTARGLAVALATVGSGLAPAAPGALAADLVTEQPPSPPEPAPVATYLWSGTYVGVYGGYNWLDGSLSGRPDVGSVHGPTGGAYVGYNYQFPSNWVTGIEGVAGFSGAEAGQAGTTVEQNWEASLRGRLGYAFENSMLYGLAGLAGSGVDVSAATGSDSNVMLGWQVGAGIETFLTNNVVGRIEYDYTDYGSENFSLGSSSTDLDLHGHAVKVGVGVKF